MGLPEVVPTPNITQGIISFVNLLKGGLIPMP